MHSQDTSESHKYSLEVLLRCAVRKLLPLHLRDTALVYSISPHSLRLSLDHLESAYSYACLGRVLSVCVLALVRTRVVHLVPLYEHRLYENQDSYLWTFWTVFA